MNQRRRTIVWLRMTASSGQILVGELVVWPRRMTLVLVLIAGFLVTLVPIGLCGHFEYADYLMFGDDLFEDWRSWGQGDPVNDIHRSPYCSVAVYHGRFRTSIEISSEWGSGDQTCSEILDVLEGMPERSTGEGLPYWLLMDLPRGEIRYLTREMWGFPFRCVYADDVIVNDEVFEMRHWYRGWVIDPEQGGEGLMIPGRILWFPLVLNVLIYTSLILVGVLVLGFVKRAARLWRVRCPRCCYLLVGAGIEMGCPECGWNRINLYTG